MAFCLFPRSVSQLSTHSHQLHVYLLTSGCIASVALAAMCWQRTGVGDPQIRQQGLVAQQSKSQAPNLRQVESHL